MKKILHAVLSFPALRWFFVGAGLLVASSFWGSLVTGLEPIVLFPWGFTAYVMCYAVRGICDEFPGPAAACLAGIICSSLYGAVAWAIYTVVRKWILARANRRLVDAGKDR